MIKLAISGYKGRMGRRISELAARDGDFAITAKIEIGDSPDAVRGSDVLIEFTTPDATVEHLAACVKNKTAIVIGTTGLSEAQRGGVAEASKAVPIVLSPNMSVGVNVLFRLAGTAVAALKDYRVSIVEAHHVHKKDAPSGTAKALAQIIKDSGGKTAEDIKSVREGEIIGDHRIIFESSVDRIELFHSAKTRDIFALGALEAAKFIAGKRPGLYSMEDVLGVGELGRSVTKEKPF